MATNAPACPHDEIHVSTPAFVGYSASCRACQKHGTGSTAEDAIAQVAGIGSWKVPIEYGDEEGLWVRRK